MKKRLFSITKDGAWNNEERALEDEISPAIKSFFQKHKDIHPADLSHIISSIALTEASFALVGGEITPKPGDIQ